MPREEPGQHPRRAFLPDGRKGGAEPASPLEPPATAGVPPRPLLFQFWTVMIGWLECPLEVVPWRPAKQRFEWDPWATLRRPNRLQRFGSLGDVGANLVFALMTGEGPDEGGRTRGSPLPAVLSRIAEAYLAPPLPPLRPFDLSIV
jgi:hypothetical protein